jgi:cyclopropane-fatty-acyl-phospholipid synthase
MPEISATDEPVRETPARSRALGGALTGNLTGNLSGNVTGTGRRRAGGRVATGAPGLLQRLAGSAGVAFDGPESHDIQVRDRAFYRAVLRRGSLGLGESYMDGLWDSARLDETIARLLTAQAERGLRGAARLRMALEEVRRRLRNLQSRGRAFQVGERHYDIGNDLYQAMLDPTMSYSCGLWEQAQDLEAAQRAKLDLICRKLELAPGERLLDIGCGWGGLAEHAAREHGVEVVGITVSREQARLARERCAGLPVAIRLMDYRDLDGRFSKVVSVGMFEHVGPKNYPAFFGVVERVLEDQGLFLLHTIGSLYSAHGVDPFIDRYIFPNSAVPSVRQIGAAIEPRFVLEDWHAFGRDYERTLLAWWDNFERAWPALDQGRYDQRFYRMWRYYLLACAGWFRARQGQLWQLVLAKPARRAVYRSVR